MQGRLPTRFAFTKEDWNAGKRPEGPMLWDQKLCEEQRLYLEKRNARLLAEKKIRASTFLGEENGQTPRRKEIDRSLLEEEMERLVAEKKYKQYRLYELFLQYCDKAKSSGLTQDEIIELDCICWV